MKHRFAFLVAGLALFALAACGGGGGGDTSPGTGGGGNGGGTTPTFFVGGNVSGLASATSVTLQNNMTDDLTVPANGTFTFGAKLAANAGYAVTVKTQPSGQTCTVTNGSGNVTTSDITSVNVSCASNSTATVVIGNTVTVAPGELGTESNPVQMPTLADYNVDPNAVDGKNFIYLQQQTGSANAEVALIIKTTGATSFLGENYPTIASFFNNEESEYPLAPEGSGHSRVPCVIFPLYVGKSGNCSRDVTKNNVSGTDVQNWKVDSVVDVTVLGRVYRTVKIVTDFDNSFDGKWIFTKYYVPDLKQYVLFESVRSDGFLVKLTLIKIE